MAKGIKLLRIFTITYWSRRIKLVAQWKDRRYSIKHLYFEGKKIQSTIIPPELVGYNRLFQEYKKGSKVIFEIHNHQNERIINSLENVH